jgi:hypothetical protein
MALVNVKAFVDMHLALLSECQVSVEPEPEIPPIFGRAE